MRWSRKTLNTAGLEFYPEARFEAFNDPRHAQVLSMAQQVGQAYNALWWSQKRPGFPIFRIGQNCLLISEKFLEPYKILILRGIFFGLSNVNFAFGCFRI